MRHDQSQIQEIKEIITKVIELLYANDGDLIQRGVNERSVAFRFALYLYERINQSEWLYDLDVDIEYSKNGHKPKKTPRRPHGAHPDIILHRRMHNDRNTLVIEIKGWWNNYSRNDDYIKLEDFIEQGGEYNYGLGVFLELEKNGCTPVYFQGY